MRRRFYFLTGFLLCPLVLGAQALSPEVRAFVSVDAPVVAMTHARVVDGTGGPAREDQTLVLSAGCDPTGIGGTLAGFGDQREVELLVEAGFTPLEAIQIQTENGAKFLGESDRIGTIAPRRQADLIVIHGDPTKNIADIEKVETVFKDGIGYDSARLLDSIHSLVGLR